MFVRCVAYEHTHRFRVAYYPVSAKRRNSPPRLTRDKVRDRDDDIWEEYQDRSTGLCFFYCPELIKSRFHRPEMPRTASEEASLKVYFNFNKHAAVAELIDKTFVNGSLPHLIGLSHVYLATHVYIITRK